MSSLVVPSDWIGDHVFFSALADQSTNVWRISISPTTGKAVGKPEKLTSGTSVEAKPAVSSGSRIAFASLKQDLNIWSLPIAGNTDRVTGDLEQETAAASDAHTSLSADGKKLVFVSTRSGNPDVWMKDLVTEREIALTVTPAHEEQSEISADGTRVSYMVWEGSSRAALYEIPSTGGVAERICDQCFRPWDWSPDASKLLFMIPEGHRQPGLALGVFDRATRQTSVYLEHPEYAALGRARFSPDGRWVAFGAVSRSGLYRIVIAAFQSSGGPPEDQWITVAEEKSAALDKPRWSPNGNLLYYASEADGFRCIRARRLDPATKRPVGPSFDVYHSHSARRSLMNAWLGSLEVSVTRDRMFFNLGETTGNIWMAEWK
jgi:Tol biopolymer transport system component